ncbi:MAG: cell division protein FtsZ [Blastocatellia bacterium]
MLSDESEAARPDFITFADPDALKGAKIKVIGVGGAGGNAVNRLIEDGMEGVEFLVANTDLQALKDSQASVKIQIGEDIARGLGAGGNPDIGKRAALEATDKLVDALDGADMIFVTAGLGGGTGTGAAPIIGSLATELGALTVAVVTKPFGFEGRRRGLQAEQGLGELRGCVDSVITIPNERLLKSITKAIPFTDAFGLADGVLRQAVRGISDIVTLPGLINVDFADVRAIMESKGVALMGTGLASGENRALEAVQRAISSPLLEEASIQGAKALLVNVTGSPDVTLFEISEAMNLIHDSADPEANIIFGAVIDDRLSGAIKITVIATNFATAAESESTQNSALLATGTAAGAAAAEAQLDFNTPAFMRKSVN